MPAAIEWFFPFHEIIEKMRWQVRQIRQGIAAAAFLQLFGRQCNVDDFFERPPGRGDACCHCAGAAVHYGLGLERPKLGFTVSVVAVL